MNRNPILATDSYKFSHFMQYPADAKNVSSFITARGTKIEGVTEIVVAGVQSYICERLSQRVTMAHVNQAADFCAKHGTPFNREGWEIIVREHAGYLPIQIEAVPEGTPIPLQNVMVQVNTLDERLPWLTSYSETELLSYIWYASSVATMSREIKKIIKTYLEITSDDPEAELPFKLHDFGFRGAAAGAAALGGYAHLINFMGTDTVAGIEHAMEYFNTDVCGFSISASEHSTMTSWGRDNEFAAYKNMVKSYAKPGAIFACVIDSYDTFAAIDMWACKIDPETNLTLLEQVKEAGATVVLRPDSGDAVQMPVDVIDRLMNHVGWTVNSKGYRVLPAHVRVIQGDGIDIYDVGKILSTMNGKGMSASNIAFGMGGGLLQKVNRDTFKFAMKASAILIGDEWHDVIKDPVTDPGKKSKAGRLALVVKDGEYKTIRKEELHAYREKGYRAKMTTVYNSSFGYTYHNALTMTEVRENAKVK